MSYYWFNRQEILQKGKERYSKEKAAAEIVIKTCQKKKKAKLKSIKKKDIKNWFNIKKKR